MIDTKAIVVEVKDRLEADRKAIRSALEEGPPPPGLEPVDDETFMAFIGAMVGKYPEQPMITDTGETIMASPWFAALPFGEGGKQIVDRVLRIQRKESDNALL